MVRLFHQRVLTQVHVSSAACEEVHGSLRSRDESVKPCQRSDLEIVGNGSWATFVQKLAVASAQKLAYSRFRVGSIREFDYLEKYNRLTEDQSTQNSNKTAVLFALERPKKYFPPSFCSRSSEKLILSSSDDKTLQDAFAIVAKGGHVSILGAETTKLLDLAIELASHGRSCGFANSVAISFPGYGPLSQSLPRHMSLSLMSRLSSCGVQLLPYSRLRFAGSATGQTLSLQFTRTFDSLHSSNFESDVLIVGPEATSKLCQQTDAGLWSRLPELAVDNLHQGVLTMKGYAVANSMLVAGDWVSVQYEPPPEVVQRCRSLGGRYVLPAGPATRIAARSAIRTLISGRTDRVLPPCSVWMSPQLGVSLLTIGSTSPALASLSVWWKEPDAQSSPPIRRSSDSADGFAQPPPPLSTRYTFSADNVLGRAGVAAIPAKQAIVTSPPFTWPLGIGISLAVQEETGRVAGIVVAGFPVHRLYGSTKRFAVSESAPDDLESADLEDLERGDEQLASLVRFLEKKMFGRKVVATSADEPVESADDLCEEIALQIAHYLDALQVVRDGKFTVNEPSTVVQLSRAKKRRRHAAPSQVAQNNAVEFFRGASRSNFPSTEESLALQLSTGSTKERQLSAFTKQLMKAILHDTPIKGK